MAVTSTVASAKTVAPFPLISHLQFLTRPDNATRPQRPIRETLGIQHPAVLDLCHTRLWESISQSLDGPPHDRDTCHCCRGKGAPIDHSEMGRCFVLLICGNMYEESSPGKSRVWQTFVDFCQAFYAPNCICRDRSAHRHSCPYFCCSMTNKYCIVSSTGDKYTFDLSNLVDLPEHLTRHSNRSFFKRPFWLSISTSSTISKCLHIFVIPPSLVLKPKSYKSFVATRCFVELSTIPSPLSIYENDFGVIGVLGTDFGSFFTIRNVMRKFAFVPTTGALKRGYPVFWSIIKDVVQNWKRVRLCNLNVQNAAESPGSPTETLGHSTDAEETSKGTTFGKESVQRSPVVRITSHIQTSSPIRSSPILPASPELPEPFSTTLPKLNTENAPATGQTKLRQAVSIKLNPFHSPSGSGENTSLSGSHSFCDSGSGDDMSHTEPVDSQPTQPILAGVADFSYGGDGGFGDDEPWLVPSIPPFFPTESGPANNTSSPSSQTYRVEAIEDEDQAPQSPPLSSFHQSSAETTEGVAQGDETGAITDDSLTDLWLETLVRLPFDLSRTTNREVPLQIQSLMELTAKLLCARQNARATDWSKLWAIHREDTPGDVISYNASFDGQVQAGLRLVLLLLQGENSSPSYKLCAYGCSKANNVDTSVPDPQGLNVRTFRPLYMCQTGMTFSHLVT